jgi:hypothetical protein
LVLIAAPATYDRRAIRKPSSRRSRRSPLDSLSSWLEPFGLLFGEISAFGPSERTVLTRVPHEKFFGEPGQGPVRTISLANDQGALRPQGGLGLDPSKGTSSRAVVLPVRQGLASGCS